MPGSVSELLVILLAEDRFSAQDLANGAGCSQDKIYRVKNERAEFSWREGMQLSRYLSGHGDNRMAKLTFSPEYSLRPNVEGILTNGRIGDEMAEDATADGLVVEGWTDRDKERALKGCQMRDEVTERLRAEIKQHL